MVARKQASKPSVSMPAPMPPMACQSENRVGWSVQTAEVLHAGFGLMLKAKRQHLLAMCHPGLTHAEQLLA